MPDTSPMEISLFVPGMAAPGGSKKAFKHATTGKILLLDMGKNNKEWRAQVASVGSAAMAGRPPLKGPLFVSFTFFRLRPKGHYGTGRNASTVKPSAPAYPTGAPDTTKLIRAAEDALLGIAYVDDAQIVHQIGRKVYGDRPGVRIIIKRIQEEGRIDA